MLFNYTKLSPSNFEELIIAICAVLFGEGIQSFSTGRDRGQDGIFEGKANKYPSEADPWEGKIIIQVKHTEKVNLSYSDKSFYNPKTKSGSFYEELIKLERYIKEERICCTHYMLWSNRTLTPPTSGILQKAIADKFGFPSERVRILGIPDLDRYLQDIPHIARRFGLLKDVIESFNFDAKDLAEVICGIHKTFVKSDTTKNIEIPNFRRIEYQQKADKNSMPLEYAQYLQEQYMPYVGFIKEFLSNPINERIKANYNESLAELQPKILSYLPQEISFDKIYDRIFDIIKNKQNIQNLEGRRKELVRVVLFYMFFYCDIGIK